MRCFDPAARHLTGADAANPSLTAGGPSPHQPPAEQAADAPLQPAAL